MDSAMTVRQVAAYLNVAPKIIYRLTQNGTLPAFKVAGSWRFKQTDIDCWIEEQKAHRASTIRGHRNQVPIDVQVSI